MMIQYFYATTFRFFSYSLVFFLSSILPPLEKETHDLIEIIPMIMGGASGIFYLFRSDTHFCRIISLLSFLCSTLIMFVRTHIFNLDIVILLITIFLGSFFFNFYFISEKRSQNATTDSFFFLILLSRISLSPDIAKWEISFLLQVLFLFFFTFPFFLGPMRTEQDNKHDEMKKNEREGELFLSGSGNLNLSQS